MDVEQNVRLELIALLQDAFICSEEVNLNTVHGDAVRCDVLAIPRDPQFAHCCLAFECKRPNQDWHYAHWSKAIKQAADNVRSIVSDPKVSDAGVITAAFIFPAPMIVPQGNIQPENELIRPGFEDAVAGMFHLASKFRVGKAVTDSRNNVSSLHLVLGPNTVWWTGRGFTKSGCDLLLQGRPIGSYNRRLKET